MPRATGRTVALAVAAFSIVTLGLGWSGPPAGDAGITPCSGVAPCSGRRRSRTGRCVDEAQEGRRVAFEDAAGLRVEAAEGALVSDVGVHPVVADGREVRTGPIAVEPIAADAGPRREVVLVAILRRGHAGPSQLGNSRRSHGPASSYRNGVHAQPPRRDVRHRPEQSCDGHRSAPERAYWCRPTRGPRAAADRPSRRHEGPALNPSSLPVLRRPPFRIPSDLPSRRRGARLRSETLARASAGSAAPSRRRRARSGSRPAAPSPSSTWTWWRRVPRRPIGSHTAGIESSTSGRRARWRCRSGRGRGNAGRTGPRRPTTAARQRPGRRPGCRRPWPGRPGVSAYGGR